MSEKGSVSVCGEDGYAYLSEEEYEAFRKMVAPHVFDVSSVKNSFLDVQYGTLPEQKLDVFLPDRPDGPVPVIFDIHGGGWAFGTKREGFLDGIINAIHQGYAVVAVDYRLAPAVRFPENLFDVKTAVRWARANAEKYGFDPDRFAMLGDSAGGHLTLMAGFTAGHPEYAGEQYGWAGVRDDLQVICDMFGPTVLDSSSDAFFRESGVKCVRGGSSLGNVMAKCFGSDDNLLRLISPISYVSRNIPPTLILQGKQDSVVAYQHSTLLQQRIEEVCGPGRSELILYEDRNHEDYAFYENDELCRTALAFFDRYLKTKD